jgi:ATP-dependent DNA ligase
MILIEQKGERLFYLACREDLEGIVAKLRNGAYDCQHSTSWIKIKNPAYTQIVGRENRNAGQESKIGLNRSKLLKNFLGDCA